MKLYLIQHAQAVSKAEDPRRPLTDEGRAEARAVARLVRSLDLRVECLWHSGKTRAEQTAEIYAGALTVAEGPTARQGLAPNDDVAPWRDALAVSTAETMIVGHMPFVSKLATLLLTGYESPPVVAFRNAGVVCLGRSSDDRWQIEWVLTPDLLRQGAGR